MEPLKKGDLVMVVKAQIAIEFLGAIGEVAGFNTDRCPACGVQHDEIAEVVVRHSGRLGHSPCGHEFWGHDRSQLRKINPPASEGETEGEKELAA